MRTISIGVSSRANIWIGSLPDTRYASQSTREVRIRAGTTRTGVVQPVAIELWYPRDTAYYALLGATFVPSQGNEILVSVRVSVEEAGLPSAFVSSLVKDVRVGLPAEYAQGVSNTVQNTPELVLLPAGVLCFDHAAHHPVGSAPAVFRRAAMAIVRLMAAEMDESATEDQLRPLLQ